MDSPLLPNHNATSTGTNTKMCTVHLSVCTHMCDMSFVTRFAKTRNNPANQYFQHKVL